MATNLKLENYSDRELVHILADLTPNGSEEGWVDIETIAVRTGMSAPEGMSEAQALIHAKRCVAVRFSWIARLSGCIERNTEKGRSGLWRLTEDGASLVKARITKTTDNQLSNIDKHEALLALDALSRRYQKSNRETANLMRREWVYGTHKRREG